MVLAERDIPGKLPCGKTTEEGNEVGPTHLANIGHPPATTRLCIEGISWKGNLGLGRLLDPKHALVITLCPEKLERAGGLEQWAAPEKIPQQ